MGDIDNDGDLDLIFANGGNFSTQGPALPQRIFINNGAGVFTDESVVRLNFSGWARGAEMGDIDDDGDLDLIFAQDFNRLPRLFENNGTGFFADITIKKLPNITLSCTRAQFGDIDNDGDLDLYLNNGGASRFTCGQHRIYVNDGSGLFIDETATLHPLGNLCEPMDVIFGDIDGDFDLDVRTASTAVNQSRLLVNDGAGGYSFLNNVPGDNNCYSYDFGDIDGDDDLDMIGVNAGPGGAELLLENDGAGNYANISGQISPNPSLDDNDSKFFDYDNDGDLDLIVARLGSGGERVYNNDSDGNFIQVSNVMPVISDSSLDIDVADLTGNGKLDVVTAQGESGSFVNRIFINDGPADTIAPRIVATESLSGEATVNGPYVIRAAILDGMTSDRNFFDKGVQLHYSVNGARHRPAPMKYSGGQIYRGKIPSQPTGSTVEYFVTAVDFADNRGVGVANSFVVGSVASVDEFELLRGVLVSGELQDLLESDDQYLIILADSQTNSPEPPISIEISGTSPTVSPSMIEFRVETRCNSPNIQQTIDLFNYSTNTYQAFDLRPSSLTDTIVVVEMTKNAEDYVEPETRAIKARIGWDEIGLAIIYPWAVRIDEAVWEIAN